MFFLNNIMMFGFELQPPDIGSNRSAKWASTTARIKYVLFWAQILPNKKTGDWMLFVS